MITKVHTSQMNVALKLKNSNLLTYAFALLFFTALAASAFWYFSRPRTINTSNASTPSVDPEAITKDNYLEKLQKNPKAILDSEDFSKLPIHKAIIDRKPFKLERLDEIILLTPNYGLSIMHCAILAGNADALNQLLKFQENSDKDVLVDLMKQADCFGTPPLFYHMAGPYRKTTDPAFITICENTLIWTECLFAQRLADGRSPLHFVSDLEGIDLPDMSKFITPSKDEGYRKLQWQEVKAKWPDQPHPLHYAIERNRIDVIEWLRKMGCPKTVESNQITALKFAESLKNQQAIDALNSF